jgi:DNA-binding XRE family transcriptional regulator
MPSYFNAATVGALVREARTTAGLTQTELANRIGASRFWVAEFEKGKPGAELGLALKALVALRIAVRIEPTSAETDTARPRARRAISGHDGLATVIAHTTLTKTAQSSVIGWLTATAPSGRSRKRR